MPHDRVVSFAEQVAAIGVDEIGARRHGRLRQSERDPHAVHARARKRSGRIPLLAHFHDTRGLGIANVSAAIEVGVRAFDASLCGLGGCPYAPGATGNIVTEDVVFLAESLGFDTGIDLDKLIAVREIVAKALPSEALLRADREGRPAEGLCLRGSPQGGVRSTREHRKPDQGRHAGLVRARRGLSRAARRGAAHLRRNIRANTGAASRTVPNIRPRSSTT